MFIGAGMHAVDHLAREAIQLQNAIRKVSADHFSLAFLLPVFVDFLTNENLDRLRNLEEPGKLSCLEYLFKAFLRGSRESSF